MKTKKIHIAHTLLFLFISSGFSAQSLRGLINDGVDNYNNKKYPDAEVNFKKGIDKEFETFEGHFNLGDALYKQGRYDEALESFGNALALTEDDYSKSKVFHNIGNALLKSQKVKESIEAYKNALRLNPDDLETKYNLSYALNMLKNQQQQQNKDQNQQDQDKNKEDQQNQDQQQQDQKQDEQKQNQQQEQEQPQKKDQISKEEAQRILEALKKNEAELQKKLRKRKAKATPKEKDW